MELPVGDADAQGRRPRWRPVARWCSSRRNRRRSRRWRSPCSRRRPASRRASSTSSPDAEDAPAIGGELTSNPLVRKVGFTGSTEVGKLLMAQCAAGLKKISLELGGNAPFVVFDDADLDEAVAGAHPGRSSATPARPASRANRILVQDGVYDEFVETPRRRRHAAEGRRRHGAPDVKVGPLIDVAAVEKVERHVADAIDRGAELHLGGARHALRPTRSIEPTVLTGVTPEMAMSSRGDVRTGGAAIAASRPRRRRSRLANDTPFGLAAYFYAATSAASGASPRRSSTAWSASTPGSSRPRWLRSAA